MQSSFRWAELSERFGQRQGIRGQATCYRSFFRQTGAGVRHAPCT